MNLSYIFSIIKIIFIEFNLVAAFFGAIEFKFNGCPFKYNNEA